MFKMSISALAIVLNESSICTKSMFLNINVHFLIIMPLYSKKNLLISVSYTHLTLPTNSRV